MVDKWKVGSNNEGLYNGVKPPKEKGGTKKKEKKEHQGRVTVAFERTPSKKKHFIYEPTPRTLLEITNSSKTCSSDRRSSLACVF